MIEKESRKIALLIDGDNAQADLLTQVIEETSKYGSITIKRIYGDWTNQNMKGWKDVINSFAIKPIQKFEYTKGKNSTDTAMIIDAMDILYNNPVEGYCLVSSDSDYTGLANRIRESGFFVMGIGKETTPKAFISACDIFSFLENLGTQKKKSKSIDFELIKKAFNLVVQDNGEALLSRVGDSVRKLDPSFDPRTFGYTSFHKLIKDLPDDYEIIFHEDKTTISIRDKKNGHK